MKLIACFTLFLGFMSCGESQIKDTDNSIVEISKTIETVVVKNYLTDYPAQLVNGNVNAIIEIPAGSIEKYELNKSNGHIERDSIDNQPRSIKYIGYPANYGMIPQTLLPKDKGGDGDPLDVIVLGPPEERGNVVECRIIGVLNLLDRGEQDDKLIAVDVNSSFQEVSSMLELDADFPGISLMIETWFVNYKGPGKMVSSGYSEREKALEILEMSIAEYK